MTLTHGIDAALGGETAENTGRELRLAACAS